MKKKMKPKSCPPIVFQCKEDKKNILHKQYKH